MTASQRISANRISAIFFAITMGVLTCVGCAKNVAPPVDAYAVGAHRLRMGELYEDAGDAEKAIGCFNEAIQSLDKAIGQNPQHAKAYLSRGEAKDRKTCLSSDGSQDGKKAFTDAFDDYQKAIILDKEISLARESGDAKLVAEYADAVPLGPLLALAHTRRGIVFGKWGQHRKAIEDFTEAIALSPGQASAYCERGAAFLAEGFPDIAIDDLTDAVQRKPDYGTAFSHRASAYLFVGDFSRAIDDSRQAIRLRPGESIAYETLGLALLDDKQYEKVVACLRTAIALDPNENQALKPRLAEGYYNWSLALRKAGKLTEADATYEKSVEADAEHVHSLEAEKAKPANQDPSTDKHTQARVEAEADLREGLAAIEKKDFRKAVDCFTACLTLDKQNCGAYFQRGCAFLEEGFPDTAVKDFDEAISLRPEYVEAYCGRARAFRDTNESFLALEDCTRAIRLKPHCADAYFVRGGAHLDRKEYARAYSDLNEAVALDSSLSDEVQILLAKVDRGLNPIPKQTPTIAETYVRHGFEFLEEHEWDKAKQEFSRSIALDKRNAEAYYGRGRAYLEQDDQEAAIEDFIQAIGRKSDYAEASCALGRAYAKTHSFLSILYCTEAIRIQPESASAYYWRGVAHLAVNQHAQAVSDLDNAQRIDPRYRDVVNAQLAETHRTGVR